jgi:hypothetical protein
MPEEKNGGFNCCHCGQWVPFLKDIGTSHRNHCPFCLWSNHVDREKPGDRESECKAKMKPIGLIFKQEGMDKYGELKQGELMIIYQCAGCGKISINRIAGDDNPQIILNILEESKSLDPELIREIRESDIKLLTEADREEAIAQLFGKRQEK